MIFSSPWEAFKSLPKINMVYNYIPERTVWSKFLFENGNNFQQLLLLILNWTSLASHFKNSFFLVGFKISQIYYLSKLRSHITCFPKKCCFILLSLINEIQNSFEKKSSNFFLCLWGGFLCSFRKCLSKREENSKIQLQEWTSLFVLPNLYALLHA